MFQELVIKNFQSHKDTNIQFENGVNVLVGASDQGKSAVLRAILWAVNNRPLGLDQLVSHWARDEKNKIAEAMLVKIETENGAVIRKRTGDTNEYKLKNNDNKKPILFSAINKDVPEDIQKFFKLTDVNIQQQHDAPFLLSDSASDVAKYFNKIVRLDIIDKVLGNAESARRDTNKKIKETENEKKSLEKQLEGFNWIETAQALSDRLLKVEDRINVYSEDVNIYENEIARYNVQKEFLKDYPDIKMANTLIEKIEAIKIDYHFLNELENSIDKYRKVNRDRKLFEIIEPGKGTIIKIESIIADISIMRREGGAINFEIKEYAENKKLSDMGFDKKKANELIKEIETIKPDYELLRQLNAQIQEHEANSRIKEQAGTEKTDLILQLPEVCPECGQPLKDCVENE
jgi:DNA repair exonuclease SbcCD ATPase subunit